MDAYHPKTFALTGGTGALGFAFLRRILRDDPKVGATLLVRQASASFQAEEFQAWLQPNKDRITLLEGDVRSPGKKEIETLLACDGGLWHFAAQTSLTAEDDEVTRTIHEVNVEGTQRLAEAWQGGRPAGPFYHVSTAYIVGKRHGMAHESETQMGQTFRNPYEASKLAAEILLQRAFADGVRGTILRPSVVVDETGRTGGFKMVDACAYAVALAVKRGEPFVFRLPPLANINMIHSDWVIAAMLDLARMPSGPGRTYHLTAAQDTYFRDIATLLEGLVPTLKISFEPDLSRAQLPTASKIFDKAITEIRPYLDADIHFDRKNTDQDLSGDLPEAPLDLPAFVEGRLQAELGRVAHRK